MGPDTQVVSVVLCIPKQTDFDLSLSLFEVRGTVWQSWSNKKKLYLGLGLGLNRDEDRMTLRRNDMCAEIYLCVSLSLPRALCPYRGIYTDISPHVYLNTHKPFNCNTLIPTYAFQLPLRLFLDFITNGKPSSVSNDQYTHCFRWTRHRARKR